MVDKKDVINQIQKIVNLHHTYLSSTPRYERYMTDETVEQWISLLGPDVCLLTHADITAKLTEAFVSFNAKTGLPLLDIEKTKMQIVPLIHDWGEIIIEGEGIGDITFEQKNTDHEIVETVLFNKVVSSIKKEAIKEALQKIYLEIVMDRNSKLGDMFNAVERLGYLQTGIQAYKGFRDKRIRNWKGLVGNVLSNQISQLLLYAKKYPYVNFFLDKHKKDITNMFEKTFLIAIPLDNKEVPCFDSSKLSKEYTAWKASAFYNS